MLGAAESCRVVGLIFTLDYEVYGTGAGEPRSLMLEPTSQLLALFNEYGVKLTIMAEVAEILAFKRQDGFQRIAAAIEKQLRATLAEGHDVQLHLHPAWFNARHDGQSWQLDFSEYSLVSLPKQRIDRYIKLGRDYIEDLARPIRPGYRCIAFRAGNWLMQPSGNVVAALEGNDFVYDTSVFKYGRRSVGPYVLDYRRAWSNLLSWVVDPNDINRPAERSGLREIPILSRKVFITSMVTLRRLRMQRRLVRHARRNGDADYPEFLGTGRRLGKLRLFYPKKFDFCRLSFREMKRFLRYAVKRHGGEGKIVPVVAIGHSTEFSDDGNLRRFLEYLTRARSDEVLSTTFSDCVAEAAVGGLA